MMRLPLALAALAVAAPVLAAGPPVDYPTGYRKWAHVKSMVIYSDKHPLFGAFGGIHHVYANPEAERALVKGGTFPDGSVLVFDLLEAKDENGAWVEGPRKLVGVMKKDRKRFGDLGGWGFEGFKGDSRTERLVTDARGQCFGCHQAQRNNDFVYSGYRP
jgi:cytochrome P460